MNACAGYDFTLPKSKNPDRNVIEKNLSEWAKRWVFQEEFAPTRDADGVFAIGEIDPEIGYAHWQGRLSLIKRRRLGELAAATKHVFPGIHWSITTTEVHNGNNFNYVMKADSRIDGPWTDQDYTVPPPLTRQLRIFKEQEPRPWQTKISELVKEEDDRSIKLIVDTEGNSGKSITCEYLEYEGLAWEIPPFRLMEDIMQCCMSIKSQKCYLIDMPRAMKKDKLSEFYAGLEALKNGVCYDKRYGFKKRRMDRPQVVVFTNRDPCWAYMSLDRWEIYDITPEFDMVKRESGAAL